MSGQDSIFRALAEEKASGRLYTTKDWLRAHPPPPGAFRQTIAGAAERIRGGEPFANPVREFLDEFSLLEGREAKQATIADPASPTGDSRYDAYLAGLAEHLAAVHDLARPVWACEPNRFLDRFWFPSKVAGFRAMAIAQSPAAFRRRGIFLSAGSLKRV